MSAGRGMNMTVLKMAVAVGFVLGASALASGAETAAKQEVAATIKRFASLVKRPH